MRTLISIVLLALAAGCRTGEGISGDGILKEEARPLSSSFHALEVYGGLRVDVRLGAETELRVQGDSNLLPWLESYVEDGTLHIGHRESLSPQHELVATLSAPALREIEAAGGIVLVVEGVDGEFFALDASGAIEARVTGQVGRCEIEGAGALEFDLRDLIARELELDTSGALDATVHATELLEVSVAGAGSVQYLGSPKLDLSQSGALDIRAIEE